MAGTEARPTEYNKIRNSLILQFLNPKSAIRNSQFEITSLCPTCPEPVEGCPKPYAYLFKRTLLLRNMLPDLILKIGNEALHR